MKQIKNISPIIIITLSFLAITQHAFAAATVDFCPTDAAFGSLCKLTISNVLQSLIPFAFILAAITALAFLIYGGFRWITSGGDKANIETARGTIVAAVVGLILIFLSYVILNLLWQFFFGNTLTSITLPQI